MENKYTYKSRTYDNEKAYQKDLKAWSSMGWEVVHAETIPMQRGCISTIFWVILSILTLGILPLIVWAFVGRQIKIVVQYRHII